MKRSVIYPIALFLALTLALNPADAAALTDLFHSRNPSFSIPAKYGRITDFYPGRTGDGEKFPDSPPPHGFGGPANGSVVGIPRLPVSPAFVLIQDLHAHPEAQQRIADLVIFGFHHWGLKEVFTEGASSKIDVSVLRSLPWKNRSNVVQALLQAGYLSGAELAAVKVRAPWLDGQILSPIQLQGVEEADIYWRNLHVYRKTHDLHKNALAELAALQSQQREMGIPPAHPMAQQLHRTAALIRLEMTPQDYNDYLLHKDLTPHTRTLHSAIASAEEFYRLAKERDGIMLKNVSAYRRAGERAKRTEISTRLFADTPTRRYADTFILVAGGFHVVGIAEQLRREGMSFVVITPRISRLGYEQLYRKRMLESIYTAAPPPVLVDVPTKLRRDRLSMGRLRGKVFEWLGVRRPDILGLQQVPAHGTSAAAFKWFYGIANGLHKFIYLVPLPRPKWIEHWCPRLQESFFAFFLPVVGALWGIRTFPHISPVGAVLVGEAFFQLVGAVLFVFFDLVGGVYRYSLPAPGEEDGWFRDRGTRKDFWDLLKASFRFRWFSGLLPAVAIHNFPHHFFAGLVVSAIWGFVYAVLSHTSYTQEVKNDFKVRTNPRAAAAAYPLKPTEGKKDGSFDISPLIALWNILWEIGARIKFYFVDGLRRDGLRDRVRGTYENRERLRRIVIPFIEQAVFGYFTVNYLMGMPDPNLIPLLVSFLAVVSLYGFLHSNGGDRLWGLSYQRTRRHAFFASLLGGIALGAWSVSSILLEGRSLSLYLIPWVILSLLQGLFTRASEKALGDAQETPDLTRRTMSRTGVSAVLGWWIFPFVSRWMPKKIPHAPPIPPPPKQPHDPVEGIALLLERGIKSYNALLEKRARESQGVVDGSGGGLISQAFFNVRKEIWARYGDRIKDDLKDVSEPPEGYLAFFDLLSRWYDTKKKFFSIGFVITTLEGRLALDVLFFRFAERTPLPEQVLEAYKRLPALKESPEIIGIRSEKHWSPWTERFLSARTRYLEKEVLVHDVDLYQKDAGIIFQNLSTNWEELSLSNFEKTIQENSDHRHLVVIQTLYRKQWPDLKLDSQNQNDFIVSALPSILHDITLHELWHAYLEQTQGISPDWDRIRRRVFHETMAGLAQLTYGDLTYYNLAAASYFLSDPDSIYQQAGQKIFSLFLQYIRKRPEQFSQLKPSQKKPLDTDFLLEHLPYLTEKQIKSMAKDILKEVQEEAKKGPPNEKAPEGGSSKTANAPGAYNRRQFIKKVLGTTLLSIVSIISLLGKSDMEDPPMALDAMVSLVFTGDPSLKSLGEWVPWGVFMFMVMSMYAFAARPPLTPTSAPRNNVLPLRST